MHKNKWIPPALLVLAILCLIAALVILVLMRN